MPNEQAVGAVLDERAKAREERAVLRAQRREQRRVAPATAAQRPPSVGGFVENVFTDAFDLVKGIFNLYPTAFKAGYEILSDPKGMALLLRDPSHLTRALGDTLVATKNALIEPYEKHGVAVGYYKPVGTALDALTLGTLGGIGLVRAGRLAGGVSRLNWSAETMRAIGVSKEALARQLAPMNRADRLVAAGEWLQRMPGELTRKAVDETVFRATGGKWDLAKRREFLARKAEEASQVPLKVKADMETVGNQILSLSDNEAALFHKLRTQGGALAEAATSPKVAAALEAYRELAAQWFRNLNARNLLTAEEAESVLAKKYAAEAFGSISKENLVKARTGIAAAEVKPVYGPAIFETPKGYTLDDILVFPRPSPSGKVGFLEEFKGQPGAVKDPRVYVPQAIAAHRKVEAKLRFVERLLQSPELIKNPKFAERLVASEFVPEGVFRKYFDDRIRAKAMQAIADPTIRRLLKWEFTRTSWGPIRLYDTVLQKFREMATLWNPRWYTGNAVGDAVLGTLAGSAWVKAAELRRAGALPPAVLGAGGMHGVAGTRSRLLEKASEIGNAADIATRAGIVTRAVADRLKAAGISFEASSEVLENVMRSMQQFSDVQVGLQILEERIARSSKQVGRLDAVIAKQLDKVQKLETSVAADVERSKAPLLSEQKISQRIEHLEAERIRLIAQQEAERTARGVAVREVKKLTREGIPGVAKRLQRAMLREQRAAVAFYRDTLSDIRKRGGVRVSPELVGEAHRIPQGLRGKGVAFDELAQELADRGVISEASWDSLADFLQEASAVVQRGRVSAGAVKAEARRVVAQTGTEQLSEVVRTTNEIAKLRSHLAEARRLSKVSTKRAEEIRAQRARATSEREQGLQAAQQEVVRLETTRDLIVRDLAADEAKRSAELGRIPGLHEQTAIVNDGVARANAFIGDYLGLDGFEQGVMRRLVPFYPWAKAMTMLAFRLPFLSTVKTFAWHRYSMAALSMVGDPDLPDWLQGYVPVFARENGDLVWLKFGSFSPFSGLRVTEFADIPIPSMVAVHEQNPIIGLGIKFAGGRTVFDRSSIPYGEQMVNISNGDVYEFTERGTLRRTIPQLPLISGVAHMFPVTQFLEDVLAPFRVTKRNWWGIPEPVLNSDGTYKYPREWWQRVGSLAGVPLMTAKSEDLKRSERIRVRQAIMAMRKAYRRADADEREYLRSALEDYALGEFRRIESR